MTVTRFGIEFNIQEDKIYLDSATIGKMPVSSLDAMCEYYQNIGNAAIRGVHQEAIESIKLLEKCRSYIADFFKVQNKQVSFLPSKETAVINALFSLEPKEKKNIITSILEDHSLLAPIVRTHQSFGVEVKHLSQEDEKDLLLSIQEKSTPNEDILILSALTPTNGILRDWKEISKFCKETNTIFILDISNLVGHEVIEFDTFSPDIIISAGCVGALGPQSTSFQIASEEIMKRMDPLIVGGGSVIALEEKMYQLTSTSSKFECGVINIAGLSALVKSLEILTNVGLEKIKIHEKKLNDLVRRKLKELPHIIINEVEGTKFGPITSFACDAIDANDISIVLEDLGNIVIRSGALCAHLFMYELPYNDIARVSTHLYNTEEEIIIFIETLNSLLSEI